MSNLSYQKDILWENANPTATFATQTITIDNLSDYSLLLLESGTFSVANNSRTDTLLTEKNAQQYCIFGNGGSAKYSGGRMFTPLLNSIKIGDCTYNNTKHNEYMIPYRIYGLK